MINPESAIMPLTPPVTSADRRALAGLLVDAVESGAAVSFLAPMTLDQAEAWWRTTLAAAHPRSIFLVARDGAEIVGTVQLHSAWAPNQPHRAEVAKLLVDRRHRRSGVGARLMAAMEAAAWQAGFRLLTLDAKRGAAAERLYRKLDWTYVGTIPDYAVDPDGTTPHAAVIFYKSLSPRNGRGDEEGETPMDPADTLTTLFRHNRWANLRILERCAELTGEQLDATVVGTYGSVRDTLEHIVRSEQSYLSRISTGQPYRRPQDAPPLTLADMTELVRATGSGLIEWAPKIRAGDTVQLDWDGALREVPKTIILTQVINHATEHRAQIMAIMTHLGVQPPEVDSWSYFDELEP